MESSLPAKEIREACWMEGWGVSGKLAGTGRALSAEGGERPRLCWVAGWEEAERGPRLCPQMSAASWPRSPSP